MKQTLTALLCMVLLASCGTAPTSTPKTPTPTPTPVTSTNTNVSTGSSTTLTTTTTQKSSTTYSAEMVAAHNTSSDCWSIINGKVYDLTNWEDGHPGGKKAILEGCGKDISHESAEHPGGDFSDASIQKILVPFYKGDLK